MHEKSLLTKLAETLDQHRAERKAVFAHRPIGAFNQQPGRYLYRWLPTPGNVLFTLLVIGSLLWAQNAGAITLGAPLATTTSTAGISYQGRIADKNGAPLTQTVNMIFRLYAAASGGSPLWDEQWTGANSVQVSDGLFNVMLGSLTPIPQNVITTNSNLFLGITVGTDSEMSPRVQLGSVPFAIQALTVPDKSITKAKLAADVNIEAPDGSITTAKLADGAATGFWYVKGTSDASTNSTSSALLPEMSLDIVTTGKPVEIQFDTGFMVSGDATVGYVSFGLWIDGQEKSRHAQRAYRSGESTSFQLAWVETLAPGPHTIQIKWLSSSDTLLAIAGAAANVHEQRILIVREHRR